jgi:hypothetical protein
MRFYTFKTLVQAEPDRKQKKMYIVSEENSSVIQGLQADTLE